MKRLLHILSVLSVLLFSNMKANGQESYDCVFNKAKGDWNVAENWTPVGVPAMPAKKVLIPAGCEVHIYQNNSGYYHYVTVDGTLVLEEVTDVWDHVVAMGPMVINEGGVLNCKGGLRLDAIGSNGYHGNDKAGRLTVYGSASISGNLTCGDANVVGTLNCSGNVSVCDENGGDKQGRLQASGNVTVGGEFGAGSLQANSGADISLKGDVNLYYGRGGLIFNGGAVDFGRNVNIGDVEIRDENDPGNVIVVDIDKLLVNYQTNGETYEKVKALIEKIQVVKDVWRGLVSVDWYDVNNWESKKIPTSKSIITIPLDARFMPLIGGDDKLAFARSVFMEQGATLTLENGGAAVLGRLYTDGTYDGSRIVINNRYDKVCSLRITDGVIKKTVGDSDIDYNKLTINTEYLTGITYYIGSATTEGTFEGWLSNLNSGSVKAGKRDEMYLYNPVMQEFNFGQTISGVKGASIYLYWKQDGVTKNTRTLTQRGTIRKQNDAISENLSLRQGEEFGWNIISNPYLFAFNLEDENQFKKSDDIDFVMFRRFRNGSYESVTHSFGTGVTLPTDATEMGGELYIAPQQGFYVKAKKAGSYFGYVPSKVPSSGTGSIGSSRLKSAKVVNDVLYLSINGNVSSKGEDQTALVFREGGSLAVNGVDADKKMESAANNHLYQLKGEGEYAIGLYPTVDEVYDEIFPLGYIVAKGATEATVRAINLDEFDNSVDVYLCDMFSGVQYDLRKNDTFTFDVDTESETGVRVDDRFAIALKANKNAEVDVPTSVECNVASVVSINSVDGDICVGVVGYEGQADAYVYDVAGRLVVRNAVSQGSNRISVPANGMYVVEVVAGDYVKNAKVLVK